VGGDGLDAGTAAHGRDCARIRCSQGCGVGGIVAPLCAGREHRIVRVADPDRHVADEGDARSAAVHGEGEQHDHPVLGGGRAAGAGLIGDQVALAEHHGFAVDHADGLDDVHVLADDRGDVRGAGEPAGEGELEAAGLGDILIAPVEVNDDGLRAVQAGAVGVGQDLRSARPVDRPGMG
jgi:hypothetical protein